MYIVDNIFIKYNESIDILLIDGVNTQEYVDYILKHYLCRFKKIVYAVQTKREVFE